MDRIARRRFVVAITGALSVGGCLDAGPGDGTVTEPTPAGSGSPTPTARESVEGTETTTPTATGTPTTTDQPTPDPTRRDALYVENLDETAYRVDVQVSGPNDDAIVDGRFRVPGRTGVDVGQFGKVEVEYDVDVRFRNGDWQEHTWLVQPCIGSRRAPSGGDTNARIIIEEGEYRFVVSACDVHGTYDIEYLPPEEVRVDG